jgi:hypothetical protein
MTKAAKYLLLIIGWTVFAIWSLLTLVVIIALIHRWTNPGWKSISNVDLLWYGELSIWLLGGFAILRLLIWLLTLGPRKYSR